MSVTGITSLGNVLSGSLPDPNKTIEALNDVVNYSILKKEHFKGEAAEITPEMFEEAVHQYKPNEIQETLCQSRLMEALANSFGRNQQILDRIQEVAKSILLTMPRGQELSENKIILEWTTRFMAACSDPKAYEGITKLLKDVPNEIQKAMTQDTVPIGIELAKAAEQKVLTLEKVETLQNLIRNQDRIEATSLEDNPTGYFARAYLEIVKKYALYSEQIKAVILYRLDQFKHQPVFKI